MKKSTGAPTAAQTQFKPENYVSANCNLEQVQEIKQAFDLFDTDQGGSVDTKCIHISNIRIESRHGLSRFRS